MDSEYGGSHKPASDSSVARAPGCLLFSFCQASAPRLLPSKVLPVMGSLPHSRKAVATTGIGQVDTGTTTHEATSLLTKNIAAPGFFLSLTHFITELRMFRLLSFSSNLFFGVL